MRILNERSEMVDCRVLIHHPKNPNKGDTAGIGKSVRALGWWGALIVQTGTNYILAGNHRFDAAVAEGATELPVVWVDVTEMEALKIVVGDNRIAARATTDSDVLGRALDFLAEAGLDTTLVGYTTADVDRLLGKSAAGRLEGDTGAVQAGIRQIMFVTNVEGFTEALDALQCVCEAEGVATNAQAIALLVGRATEESW